MTTTSTCTVSSFHDGKIAELRRSRSKTSPSEPVVLGYILAGVIIGPHT